MKNQQVANILEGAIIVVLGVLIAVVGIGQTVDIYFGVLFTAVGGLLALFLLYSFIKDKFVPIGLTLLSGASLALGIALFTKYVSFAMLVNILIMVVLGVGAGLIFYGLYLAARKNVAYGIVTMVIGAAIVTLTALYLNVDGFAQAFWIIVGVLVALYGALLIVYTLVNKPSNKKKK